MYELFKDFAGPAATFVAAIAAIVVTAIFNVAQLRIAKSQRNIALDKLKYDLFEKRYEIYEAAKALLEYIPFISDLQKSDATKIRSLYVKIDEARFYFPPDIRAVLDATHNCCELFFSHLAERDRLNIDDRERWSQLAETLAQDQSALRAIYASLPEKFETSLAFSQLTANR